MGVGRGVLCGIPAGKVQFLLFFQYVVRSALKKILERDDVSSRTMVLCVSSVSVSDKEPEGVAQEKKDQDGKNDTQVVAKKTEVFILVLLVSFELECL